ncbi:MAG TPA: hypothetical protein VLG37_05005 [Candidatus Saccharimonadales bacterium]|nr:hypothetical protein [Candidatus Saccharimonadales bacterium]
MKNKGFIYILVGLLLLIGIVSVAYFKSHQDNTLPDDLRKQFRCDRITNEALSTDRYCNDYNLYKKDHAAGII